MSISTTDFKKNFSGFNIIDCVVRDRNIFYFIAREDYTLRPNSNWNPETTPPPNEEDLIKHVIPWMRHKDIDAQWSTSKLTGFQTLFAGVSIKPKSQFVGVSTIGDVYVLGANEKGIETDIQPITEGGAYKGGVFKLKTIDGWLYFCGGQNSVGKRIKKNEWIPHPSPIPNPVRSDNLSNRFNDIDGFNEEDIYCVGTEGGVYHFNKNAWTSISFPTNNDLENVCCAGDGFVYIADDNNTIYKGRQNEWKLIHKGKNTLPFRDMVWYKDRIWCTSDYGVWTIKNDKSTIADIPDGMVAYAGNLSAADGVLLLAGYGGAAFLQDGQWTKIFSISEMKKLITDEKNEKQSENPFKKGSPTSRETMQ